jgi:hypothetical protein
MCRNCKARFSFAQACLALFITPTKPPQLSTDLDEGRGAAGQRDVGRERSEVVEERLRTSAQPGFRQPRSPTRARAALSCRARNQGLQSESEEASHDTARCKRGASP